MLGHGVTKWNGLKMAAGEEKNGYPTEKKGDGTLWNTLEQTVPKWNVQSAGNTGRNP
jgi:hypothetical protein